MINRRIVCAEHANPVDDFLSPIRDGFEDSFEDRPIYGFDDV